MTQATVLQMLVSGQNDLAWFEASLESLRARYNNQFIAFHNKQVIDSDINLDNLIQRLKTKEVDTSNLFVKFVSKIKAIL